MASFVRHGAEFHLFTDDLGRKVPNGVILHDARALIGKNPPRYGPRSGRTGSLALAADTARMKWLHRNGGWWVDMDVVCLRSFEPLDHGIQIGWQDNPEASVESREANVAVIRLPKSAELAHLLIRRARFPWLGSPWESPATRVRNLWRLRHTFWNPGDVPWGWTGGPHALTAVLHHLGLAPQVHPPSMFYPVPYFKWRDILEMSERDLATLAGQSYALHLWAEMFRGAKLDTDAVMRDCQWARPYLEDYPA